MSGRVRWGVLGLALSAACSSSQERSVDGNEALSASGLPCDVGVVVQANCQRCHASRPLYGAPMPLMTVNDVKAPAVTDRTQTVAQRMAARIHDPAKPMPPTGPLPAADLAVLDAWLAAGAPQAGPGCRVEADAGAASTSMAPALPCPESEQTTFRAHASGSDEPFALPDDAENSFECFVFAPPWASGTQATAFAPVIDDPQVLHHMLLVETSTPPKLEGGVGPCDLPADATFQAGWAPGNPGFKVPDDVGFHLADKGKWLILQLHYWNVGKTKNVRDRSGISMCTTSTPRPNTAVVSTLGSMAVNIPPRTTNVAITGRCTPQLQEPVHVIASGPHMHKLGRSFTTEILRGGNESDRVPLVNVPNWDFNYQEFYPSDLLINPGDKLVTTCRYDNTSDTHVAFGERTEDEMCFNFLAVWPAPGVVNAVAGQSGLDRCIDP